jgi:hypothetical protein
MGSPDQTVTYGCVLPDRTLRPGIPVLDRSVLPVCAGIPDRPLRAAVPAPIFIPLLICLLSYLVGDPRSGRSDRPAKHKGARRISLRSLPLCPALHTNGLVVRGSQAFGVMRGRNAYVSTNVTIGKTKHKCPECFGHGVKQFAIVFVKCIIAYARASRRCHCTLLEILFFISVQLYAYYIRMGRSYTPPPGVKFLIIMLNVLWAPTPIYLAHFKPPCYSLTR